VQDGGAGRTGRCRTDETTPNEPKHRRQMGVVSSHISQNPALAPAPRSGVRTKVFSPDLTVSRDSSNKALKEHDIACDICDKAD